MPNPYPVALRERAVRAYEDSTDTYQVVAARYAISVNALVRWVQLAGAAGEIAPRPKGGGCRSSIELPAIGTSCVRAGCASLPVPDLTRGS